MAFGDSRWVFMIGILVYSLIGDYDFRLKDLEKLKEDLDLGEDSSSGKISVGDEGVGLMILLLKSS